ncbi:unnamed protein product [Didymodactylos carnosus]|uniref:Retrotransposon gag domain-containing protein n=1 Tax=Didymodactylos carnosus TaxID=1234261 RepID=A0A813XXB9_9BILA|nr:unnamed protein product [Didymodactylos carnosus]CAF0930085.1 unnamed protein product [Didymodactylos carnosus]CAF3660524.1 unnamed protein product [Didymodactylos carnosus]CAF3706814.1 unnamed protein product [Didymodactylos carnosus]
MLLAKIPDVGNTVESISQWLKFIELIWGKLNYPLVCWSEGASQHLLTILFNLWYLKSQQVINNDGHIFKHELIEYMKSPEEHSLTSATAFMNQQPQQPAAIAATKTESLGRYNIDQSQARIWYAVSKSRISDFDTFVVRCTVLQDLALKWYNRNSSTIKSWPDFVIKIKEEFGSKSWQQEAFEKLKNYQQTVSQSVTEYHATVMDICHEIDPPSSNDQILQYLISNVKPSLKIKILEKQPKTTTEYLHYTKTFEHLAKLAEEEVTSMPSNIRNEQAYIRPPKRTSQQQE